MGIVLVILHVGANIVIFWEGVFLLEISDLLILLFLFCFYTFEKDSRRGENIIWKCWKIDVGGIP